MHVELLECATSDVLAEESSRSAEAPSAYPAPPTDSLTGIVDAMAAAGVPLNQWLGAAGLGTAEATPPRGANGDANGDENSDSTVRNSHPPLDLAAARDLAGVPVPTASGETRPIGNGVLYAGTETMVSLAPRLRGRFLHPSLIADSKTLAPLLRHPRFNAATNTCVFGFDELLAELPRSLPARLAPAKIAGLAVVRWREARAPEAPSSLAARDEGDSRFAPSPAWLRALWDALAPREVLAMNGVSFDWTNAGKFDEWPLVPCESETLVRVKHAGAVFVAPDFVDERRHSTDPAASDDPADETSSRTNVPTTNDVTRDLPNFHDGSNRLASDWHWLAPALRAARFPVLDTRAGGAACAAAVRAAARPTGLTGTIRTPADAFVWKLMCASEQFGDASSSGFPFDFAKTSTAFRTRLFETLVSQFETSDLLRTPKALEAVKTHLPIFFRAERRKQKRVFAGDETLVSHSETDSTVETTHPHHTRVCEKIWVSLRSTHTHFTTCPPDVPFAEASYRSPETLAYVAAALPLYRALGVEVLDDAATLARHVVPEMARLNTQGRAAVLAYVLKHWPRLKDSEALVEALARARFVDVDEDDDFKSPRDLYDPEVELFALTFKDTPAHFPGKAFRSREWLEVLRTCGIRSAVDAKLFTECATRVAARAAELGAAFPTCADADLMSVPGEKMSVPARAETRHVRVATWRPRGRGASHVSR